MKNLFFTFFVKFTDLLLYFVGYKPHSIDHYFNLKPNSFNTPQSSNNQSYLYSILKGINLHCFIFVTILAISLFSINHFISFYCLSFILD